MMFVRPPPLSIEQVVSDADWLAHRYDPGQDTIHFIHISRQQHRKATFLTDQYLAPDDPVVIARTTAINAAPPPAPVHFIFHSAFCCSTLIARALDIPRMAFGLKEPTILNDIVGWRQRGGKSRQAGTDLQIVLDQALGLLARPFEPSEATIIKPSNVTNGLAASMLMLRPDAQALLMYAPLETYLTSIAKKGLDGRLWVRTLLRSLLRDDLVDLGFAADDYLGLTDLQVAAVGWLAQYALFANLVRRFGPGRVRTIDSECIFTSTEAVLFETAQLFRLPLDRGEVATIATGPAFTHHSKTEARFDAAARIAENQAAADLHRDEINKVKIWAHAVASASGLSLEPPAPLV